MKIRQVLQRMNHSFIKTVIDELVEFSRIQAVPCDPRGVIFEMLEHTFEVKIPGAYRYLLSEYDFDAFSLSGVDFYGSNQLIETVLKDQFLFDGLKQLKLVPIGRPGCGSYDPICIDTTQKRIQGEFPLVQVDHESILLNRKKVETHIWTPSTFLKMASHTVNTQ